MKANEGEKGNLRHVSEVGTIEQEEDEEDIELLKKDISTHPLFPLLIEAHLDCLKVSLGEKVEIVSANAINQLANLKLDSDERRSRELDHFMERYCSVLGKLKEAMEKQLEETTCVIDSMYEQLRDICRPNNY